MKKKVNDMGASAAPSRASGVPLSPRKAKSPLRGPSARSRKKFILEAAIALSDKALDAVDHVGAANYAERQREARLWVHDAFDRLLRTIHRQFRGISALGARSAPKAAPAKQSRAKASTKGTGRVIAATPKKK